MRVAVPASSANLGPGFDTLGLALDLPFLLSTEADPALIEVEGRNPAGVAFAEAGGKGTLWWRSPIPPGRGLGFSGSARVAGALLGFLQRGLDEAAARGAALQLACRLEGHPDNAAASLLGGAVAAIDGTAVRIPLPDPLQVVVWWPATETSTNKARAALPATVPFEDAVFNLGRTAVIVAALASGNRSALGEAMDDRLHQAARLAQSPASAAALDALRSAGSLAAWLSGSGPTVAAFVEPGMASAALEALPTDGTARVLDIDLVGARVLEG